MVEECVFAITSLSRLHANAEALLKLSREHWSIENRVHYVRDVAFGEDACTVSTGNAPQLLAALRNASLFLLRAAKWKSITKAMRRLAAKPTEAIHLVTGVNQNDF
jgi:predicted transposase YbfD/YdcC